MKDYNKKLIASITEYDGQKIKKTVQEAVFYKDDSRENEVVNLYPFVKYQTLEGFGATITEAAAYTFSKMSKEKQRHFLEECFGSEGLNYNMTRMALDSCDASLGNYSAMNEEDDKEMKSFSLERDEQYILPLYQEVSGIRKEPLQVMLSPWSPPSFMKTNGEKNHGGKLKKKYYQMWAEYFCRYIEEYRKRGVDVRRISIQNEPNAVQIWDSCCYTGAEEKVFLKDYLYPALEQHSLTDVEVYIWDHNKERLVERARDVIDSETDHMVSGVAFHWYSGDHFEALDIFKSLYPDKKVAFSEGCVEYSKFSSGNQLQNARMYGHDMIGNLNGGAVFLVNWSILFDSQGGPNHVENWCEAPLMYDTKTDTLEKKLSYYYIQHFSRYVVPGSVRIGLTKYTDKFDGTAVQRPDGSLVAVLMNRTETEQNVYIRLEEEAAYIRLPGASIATVMIEKG